MNGDMAIDTSEEKPVVGANDALTPKHKKVGSKLIIICLIVFTVLLVGVFAFKKLQNDTKKKEVDQYTQALNIAKPSNGQKTLEQKSTEDLQNATSYLQGKTEYTQQDLGALVSAAIAANALNKKAEAKQYAQAALKLIENNKDYQSSYPNIVMQMQELAK
jgi:flagellar basal body-associated protein FliL